MDSGTRRSKRLKVLRSQEATGLQQLEGGFWSCALPEVLQLVLAMVEEHEDTVFLKHARLVNRHWLSWASNATQRLEIDCGTYDYVACNKLLKRFTGVEDVALLGVEDYDPLEIRRLHQVTHLKVEYCELFRPSTPHLPLVQVGDLTTLVSLELLPDSQADYPRSPVKDGDLNALVNLKRLTKINLSHSRVTCKCVGALEKLPSLTDVDLSGCSEFGDHGMQQLAGLTRIAAVRLRGCTLGDRGVKALGLMLNLTVLNIDRCKKVSNEGVCQLGSLTKLTELHLPPHTVASGVQCLGALTAISSLVLNDIGPTLAHSNGGGDEGVKLLAQFPALSRLVLKSCSYISDNGAGFLGTLTGLVELGLHHCGWSSRDMVRNSGIVALTNLTALESLSLSQLPDTSREGLQPLGRLTKLRVLRLVGLPLLFDDTLAALTSLTLLVELSLRKSWKVTLEGVDTLEHLTSLTKVDLAGCHRVTNVALESLGRLHALMELDLQCNPRITNAGLMHLVPLRFLRRVNLHGHRGGSRGGKRQFLAVKRKWEEMHG
ncbi:unnamed protein product [Ostreobium quekettii]|uniref:F-box/LRR-repeat protein 15-like leucin rich repeat domain-containing protein n=1 Tax=Ostreobium quekettii TaxID=121088 RepID=A0A8S1IR58_9CHLO|nr:unnamed protein product [Ostreobium quekettii]|eukprot:evm.model.scf_1358.1 EVM.evm.TU.scf_1358.1   scf_1358:13132-15441(-)